MTRARTFLQQQNFTEARAELDALESVDGLLQQPRWEAEALRKAIPMVSRVRANRPRLFFNNESWPAVRERALTEEKAHYDRMAQGVNAMSLEEIVPDNNWGMRAMEAAFVYRMTGDPDVLEKVRRMLRVSIDTYLERDPIGRNDTRAYARIACVAALDWVWDDLLPDEREALRRDWIAYLHAICEEARVRGHGLALHPNYYERDVFLYAGLTLLDPGMDEADFLRLFSVLAVGLAHNREAVADRIRRAGDDGGWHLNAGYHLAEYASCYSYPVMHVWQSATGAPIPGEWIDIGVPPEFALREVVWIGLEPGWGAMIRHFGYSRTRSLMSSSLLYDHLGQAVHFFGKTHPKLASIAHYLRRRIAEEGRPSVGAYPVYPFLLTGLADAPPPVLPDGLPPARHYENIGLVLMSSGFEPEDVYALLAVGGGVINSEHLDTTHFTIYKQGMLAVDSGARQAGEHSANYWSQTVAHNAVLIRMPGEQAVDFVGRPVQANSGGQNRPTSHAEVLAFEAHPLFAYAATDAAPTYHEDTCAQMVRQFIYLPPDHFVVFDRVTSKNADFPKTWLFHTAHEPVVSGREFKADAGEGRVFCRTLLPADAVLESVGGPGREFWADGRNWDIPEAWWDNMGRGMNREIQDDMGRWRMEVRPGAAREEDHFLHLIQVSDPSTAEMADSRMDDLGDQVELVFATDEHEYRLRLNKTGPVGGHIRVAANGRLLVDRPLREDVMPQSGLALME